MKRNLMAVIYVSKLFLINILIIAKNANMMCVNNVPKNKLMLKDYLI